MKQAKVKHIAKARRIKLQHSPADHGPNHPVVYHTPKNAARGPRPNTFAKQQRPTPQITEEQYTAAIAHEVGEV